MLCDEDKPHAVFFLMHMQTVPAILQADPKQAFPSANACHASEERSAVSQGKPKNILPQKLSAQGALEVFFFQHHRAGVCYIQRLCLVFPWPVKSGLLWQVVKITLLLYDKIAYRVRSRSIHRTLLSDSAVSNVAEPIFYQSTCACWPQSTFAVSKVCVDQQSGFFYA